MKDLSIIICVFNEEKNIKPLVEQIHSSINVNEYNYEIIYVDDGSKDKTVENIISLNDSRIKLVELRKNYGQSSALSAGIEEASGKYIALMDGDLQNDPSDIPMMLEILKKEDRDLVAGIRANRKDGIFLRKIPSKIANSIIRKSTGIKIKDYGCTLKVFKSDIAKDMRIYGELHRFIPVLASFEGGTNITQVNVKHHARIHGTSKYGINRTFKVMSDLLVMIFRRKYMQKPMHLFGSWGIISLMAGIGIEIYLLVLKLMGEDIWGRPLMLLGILLILAGIQLITFGIMADTLMRTYYESQNKRPYKVKRIHIAKEIIK